MRTAIDNLKTFCRAAAVMLLGGAVVLSVSSAAVFSTIDPGATAFSAIVAPTSGDALEAMVMTRTELASAPRDLGIGVVPSCPGGVSSAASRCSGSHERPAAWLAPMRENSAVTPSRTGSEAFCQGDLEQRFG